MSTAPILDLTTLEPDRPKVRIDGRLYELAVMSDFGLLAQARLARILDEAGRLEKDVRDLPPPEPTGNADVDATLLALGAIPESHAKRLDSILDEAVEFVLRAPAEVRALLNEAQKRAVVEAFTPTVLAAAPTNRQGRRASRSRSTSGSSSRPSRRRTATPPG